MQYKSNENKRPLHTKSVVLQWARSFAQSFDYYLVVAVAVFAVVGTSVFVGGGVVVVIVIIHFLPLLCPYWAAA